MDRPSGLCPQAINKLLQQKSSAPRGQPSQHLPTLPWTILSIPSQLPPQLFCRGGQLLQLLLVDDVLFILSLSPPVQSTPKLESLKEVILSTRMVQERQKSETRFFEEESTNKRLKRVLMESPRRGNSGSCSMF